MQIDQLEEERSQYVKKLETVERKLKEANAKKIPLKAKTKRLDKARLRKFAFGNKMSGTPAKGSEPVLCAEDVKKELDFDTNDGEDQMIEACKTVEGQMGLFPEGDDGKTAEELLENM